MVRRASSSNIEEIPAIPALTDPSQNPYYVHPNESATAALVTPLLDGKNYQTWSGSMMKAVIMKNKLRFLDGSCPMPDQFDPTHEPWIRCNNLVLSWLMNSVIPTISQSLVYTDMASQAWNDLKARFSRADRVRVSSLQRKMYALCQDSSSVTAFFTKLKGLWQELELYRPIPNCTCTFPCVCEAMRNAKKFKEEDLIILFLTGLNDNYAMVRSHILLMEPFP
ncbi:retrovirus-related pol polyprotein from transposon TNT 1-94 [Trifolium medium]|uniref:Retrovirus-related pol polyprotein from transposon TNT 1-94 n=1 Tax=Trifolium medium TaxID=97028 RepID=A0A392LYH9_9FABA|nr:retrovirus-related pol polyprotein from transposon TNT 1-94 [Trifolium medium]